MRTWFLDKTFNTKIEAINQVSDEDTWSYSFTNETADGRKIYYRCNKVKKRGAQCPAVIHLLVDNRSEQVMLFRANEEHKHDHGLSKTRLLDAAKQEIKKLFELHVKPKAIWA